MVITDLLTVKELANILGCSVQAVYNRLEKDFKPYLKIENGKKRIDRAVLDGFKPKENSTDFQVDFKAILNLLEKQNDQLHKELEIKNKQIEDLTATVKIQAQGISAGQHSNLAETLIEGYHQQFITDETNKITMKDRLKHLFKKV